MHEENRLNLLPQQIALPRGRSALPKSVVDASRLGRIMQATLEEVAASGYTATTVATIIKRARVSRTSFYAAFADKEAAFAAAHLNASDRAVKLLGEPALQRPGVPFHDRVLEVMRTYLDALETEPVFAVCFFVEIKSGGERLAAQRDELLDDHVRAMRDLMKVSAVDDASLRVPSPDVLRGVMGAFDELVTRAVREQRDHDRLDLKPILVPFSQILAPVLHAF